MFDLPVLTPLPVMMIGVMGVRGETWVTGASKEGEGGGEDVTMAGQTNKQGKIELVSQLMLEG